MTIELTRRTPGVDADPVHELAADVAWVPLSLVNAYLVGPYRAASGAWVLIDAGMSFSGRTIREAAAVRFGPRSRPAAIVLTHGHFDHVGALRELAEEWDVPVYAHPLELPYLTGKSDYPPPDPTVGGGLMAYSARLFSRRGIDLGDRVRPLPAVGTVPHMPGWTWVHTPGHSPGHVAFFREADRFLIAGDAVVTTKQESASAALTGQPLGVRRPPAYFTTDWEQAKRSVQRLAELRPEVLATGHGFPMRGPTMRRELEELAGNFDRAMPAYGRYVGSPAVADETGLRHVPPPAAAEVLAGVVAAFGLGALVGWMSGRA
jgi:glyoxylase-like metal-dependent hydrolase (beta-lactamase superfamily II)